MERLAYRVYNDLTNELIADIYESEHNNFRAQLYAKGPMIPELFGFPEWGSDPNPESKYILAWLEDRVIPPNRDYLKETLEANGIYEYDWRVLIKLNQGRSCDDPFRVETCDKQGSLWMQAI